MADHVRRSPARTAGLYVAVALGVAAMVGPFVWMLLASLKTDADIRRVPPGWWPNPVTGENYAKVVHNFPFWGFLRNSVIVSVVSTAVQLFLASTAAFAFARIPFRGSGVLFGVYLATMMIPLQVVIVPLFIEMRALRLVSSYAGLILPGIVSSFGVFLMRQAFLALPQDLFEAARLDGAGIFASFWRIGIPLVAPALATFAVFAFMSSWNAFLWPLVITRGNTSMMTLPVGLSQIQGRFATNWNVLMAGSVLTLAPMAAFYAVAQRWVIRSVAFTGSTG